MTNKPSRRDFPNFNEYAFHLMSNFKPKRREIIDIDLSDPGILDNGRKRYQWSQRLVDLYLDEISKQARAWKASMIFNCPFNCNLAMDGDMDCNMIKIERMYSYDTLKDIIEACSERLIKASNIAENSPAKNLDHLSLKLQEINRKREEFDKMIFTKISTEELLEKHEDIITKASNLHESLSNMFPNIFTEMLQTPFLNIFYNKYDEIESLPENQLVIGPGHHYKHWLLQFNDQRPSCCFCQVIIQQNFDCFLKCGTARGRTIPELLKLLGVSFKTGTLEMYLEKKFKNNIKQLLRKVKIKPERYGQIGVGVIFDVEKKPEDFFYPFENRPLEIFSPNSIFTSYR